MTAKKREKKTVRGKEEGSTLAVTKLGRDGEKESQKGNQNNNKIHPEE